MNTSIELKKTQDQQVTISGMAGDAKAGAVVTTDRNEVIYLRDLRSWPEEFLDKRVMVEGVLRRGRVYPEVKVQGGITSQGIKGEQWYLEVESYRLEESDG